MADWYRRTTTVTRYEWVVPVRSSDRGADWNQVQQALNAAVRVWRQTYHQNDLSTIPSDDVIRVSPGDDEIVIWFEEEGKEG